MAWQQGDDLYTALNYRLMKDFEYVAKYNWQYDENTSFYSSPIISETVTKILDY